MTPLTRCMLLAAALWFAVLPLAGAPAPQTITVVLDGKPIDFYSQIMDERIPAVLVEGYAMLPVRFFNEALNIRLDLSLWPWQIVRLGDVRQREYAFKLGETAAYTPAPAIGGELSEGFVLPIAPRIIQGRFYVPAQPTLGFFGYDAAWDAKGKVLMITKQIATK